jgi:hypothetical protein
MSLYHLFNNNTLVEKVNILYSLCNELEFFYNMVP